MPFTSLTRLTCIQRLFHDGFKVLIEVLHHVGPLLIAFGYAVEILFHLGSEVVIHDGGEIFHEEVVDDDTDIRRLQLALVRSYRLFTHRLFHLLAFQRVDGVGALFALMLILVDVFTLLDGRNGGCIGRRTANTQFLQLVHQRSLCIALWTLAEALSGLNLTTRQLHAFLQRRQQVAFFLLLFVVVHRLTIDLDETVKLDHLADCHKLIVRTADGYVDCRLFQFCICHLRSNGALPDEFIEPLLLSRTLNGLPVHIGRTDGFVSLLGTLRTGVILTHLAVFGTIQVLDFLLRGIDAERRQVD